jgi:ABC-type antimicrobial peptide transport system permease subunit
VATRAPQTLSLLKRWANLLDSRFRIPGTSIRFGLDPLLSLVPGLGDLVSPVFALALVAHGVQLGVPKVILVRMLANALLDAAIGAVPLAGNVADIFWRANTANLALLERFAQPGRRPTRGDYAFVFAIAAAFGMVVFGILVLAIWAAAAVWRMF